MQQQTQMLMTIWMKQKNYNFKLFKDILNILVYSMSVINSSFIEEKLSFVKDEFTSKLDNVRKELCDTFNTNTNQLLEVVVSKSDEILELNTEIQELRVKSNKLLEENLNYQKVSLVKSLNSQLNDKDGEIRFLTSKVKHLTEQVQKLKAERDTLEKQNFNMSMTLGLEIVELLKQSVLPHLDKGNKILLNTKFDELISKYYNNTNPNTNKEFAVNMVLISMLTHLNEFGNIMHFMTISLKKLGVWFKSPVIKKCKSISSKNVGNTDIITELQDLLIENNVISQKDIQTWYEYFTKEEDVSKFDINLDILNLFNESSAASEEEDTVAEVEETEEVEEETEEVEEETETNAVAEVEETETNAVAEEEETEEVEEVEEETEEVEEVEEETEEVSAEEEASAEEEEEEVSAAEEETEFYELELKNPKTKKKQMYLITDDDDRDIYEVDDDGELGECVGRLVGKNDKPRFD